MTRRKFIVFTAIAVIGATTMLLMSLLAADLYLHHRAERSAGLNRWGYRGPVVGRKQANEVRVAMLGGSTVFGYGGQWDEAIPALLERELNASPAGLLWRVINLGYNSEGAFAFRGNLEDFAFLDYDLVILYEGYNDMQGSGTPNKAIVRRESPVFRLTGYLPILPLVFREKAMALRTGNLTAAYESRREGAPKPVFKPGLSDRTSAAALDITASVAASLEHHLGRFSDHVEHPPAPGAYGCPEPWEFYCDSQQRAIEYATSLGKRVLVVSQPKLRDERVRDWHASQHRSLAAMVASRFGQRSDVAHADLREVVDVMNPELSFDQMHLTPAGNRLVAAALAAPVKQLQSR
jgi:hypothetical protein